MEIIQQIKAEIQKIIVDQEKLIDSLILALITNSHLLIEGVPGIAKTTSVNTLAKTIDF
jgi:MoxR-like ATPase